MATKKKETETKVEEKKDNLVTIEVEAKDKEAFAEFLAKKEILEEEKKAIDLAAKEPKKMFFVTLKFQHNVNGKRYGPGRIQVNGELLGHLLSADQKSANRELSNMMQRDRVYKLTQGSQVVLVKDTVN